jgi:DNA-binding response OmpR family regulator
MEVHSEPAKGTALNLYLPRASADRSITAPSPGPAPEGTALVAEDDAVVRALVKRTLERKGFRVLSAGSGGEALALGADHPGAIDLLISDLDLAGTSGRDLFEKLKEHHPALRVLYLSAYPDDTLPHHHPVEPGTPVLSKPFSTRLLSKKVREVLGGDGNA